MEVKVNTLVYIKRWW